MTSSSFTLVQHTLAVRSLLSVLPNGAAIFSGILESGQMVRVLAPAKVLPRPPISGETWFVAGELRNHVQYGEQLHANICRYELPQGRLIIRYLADSPDFEGIGESKASKLWEMFGDQLAPLLCSGDVESLESVLTRDLAKRLVQVWSEKRAESELIVFLDAHGLDWRLSTKLRRVWGAEAKNMLEVNPYHLLAFASWPQVDGAAMKLGLSRDDDRRLVGAVESTLYDRLLQAHTLTDHETLTNGVEKRLKRKDALWAITCALTEGAILGNVAQGYQAAGAAALERGATERIRAMLGGKNSEQKELFPLVAEGEWARMHIQRVESEQGFLLNDAQRLAVVMPFQYAFSLLTGGAGVGKTAVLRVIIKLAEHQSLPILQMALAGRAAQRMTEATGHPAMTIAKFLALAGQKLEVPSHCLIVIDEASMLDLPTFYRILRQLPDGARMLLVGDPAQLPPIGFGLVFHQMVSSQAVPQTHLVQVHRQAESSGIPAAASAVRQHLVPFFVPFHGNHSGVSFIDCSSDDTLIQLRGIITAWEGEDWQILAAVKGGRTGIQAVNTMFHFEAWDDDANHSGFRVGEPVMHLLNDYERGLMNGSLGRVSGTSGNDRIVINFEGEEHEFAIAELRDRIELAYAISVHKAQGSQFKRVVVVVGKSRILDHALIYTALTRGIEQVVFIGDRDAFAEAVLSPPLAQQRSVAFSV